MDTLFLSALALGSSLILVIAGSVMVLVFAPRGETMQEPSIAPPKDQGGDASAPAAANP